jgi:hypothetical protein
MPALVTARREALRALWTTAVQPLKLSRRMQHTCGFPNGHRQLSRKVQSIQRVDENGLEMPSKQTAMH